MDSCLCDLFVEDAGHADVYYQILGPLKPSGNWFNTKISPRFVYRCVMYDSYTIFYPQQH
jgi:hypothetical protein